MHLAHVHAANALAERGVHIVCGAGTKGDDDHQAGHELGVHVLCPLGPLPCAHAVSNACMQMHTYMRTYIHTCMRTCSEASRPTQCMHWVPSCICMHSNGRDAAPVLCGVQVWPLGPREDQAHLRRSMHMCICIYTCRCGLSAHEKTKLTSDALCICAYAYIHAGVASRPTRRPSSPPRSMRAARRPQRRLSLGFNPNPNPEP